MTTLEEAQSAREEKEVDALIDAFIDQKLKHVRLAAPISPHARVKLREAFKRYAKEDFPFRACMRDLTLSLGPGRSEAVCCSIKESIKGKKKWRGGSTKMGDVALDGETLLALDAISEIDLQAIFLEARALEEHGSTSNVALLGEEVNGASELRRWGADGEIGLAIISAKGRKQMRPESFALPGRRYPIPDKEHAVAALARVKQHGTPEEQKKVKAAVCRKFPGLPACQEGK